MMTLNQPWGEALGARHDFYHLPGYHSLAERRGEGAARLFVHKEGGYSVALPLLLRPLDGGLQDATSVYGYAGPAASHEEAPRAVLENFRAALRETLAGLRVVTVFSRLHPLLRQREIVAGLGDCVAGGNTISIDLTLPEEAQRAQFRSDHKRGINKARRAGMTVAEGAEHLDAFIEIYTETMRRVNAAGHYFFDRAYFEELMALGDVRLFAALSGGEVTAGALLFTCNGIVQYHLGGTRGKYLELAPMKLVFETVRLWAMEQGHTVFHLGGGVGSREDSLFHFKAGFSDRRHPFFTWRWVIDQEACDALCAGKAGGAAGFFPPYRA